MNDIENRKILNGKSNNILSLKVKSYNDDKINLINYISFAKMISSFGVVTLHINGGFWSYNISKKKKWIVQNLYDNSSLHISIQTKFFSHYINYYAMQAIYSICITRNDFNYLFIKRIYII